MTTLFVCHRCLESKNIIITITFERNTSMNKSWKQEMHMELYGTNPTCSNADGADNIILTGPLS